MISAQDTSKDLIEAQKPLSTCGKGSLGELMAAVRAKEKGFEVSFPLGNPRYDLIIDTGEKLLKAQVKLVSRTGDRVVAFLAKKSQSSVAKSRNYLEGEIDILLIVVPGVGVAAITPEKFSGKRSITLRLSRPAINQPSVLFFSDFLW